MESSSTFKQKLKLYTERGWISHKIEVILSRFYDSFRSAISSDSDLSQFDLLLDLVKEQLRTPFIFQPYHQKIIHPFDYYHFGMEFFRPLVDKEQSTLLGQETLHEIQSHLKAGHNVIFFANHQIEADPQAISLLFEPLFHDIASEMIFVAGERVITDPVAVPFSMGRNLLCIYSKRYIDHPPEHKASKQLHNKKTMEIMSALLSQGGKCIYVAPSGGRDRPDASGVVHVANFDPQSIQMFYLMAQKSATPTFFYPMALSTFKLLPPPSRIEAELGEARSTQRSPIHIAVGPSIEMEAFPQPPLSNKHLKRVFRAEYIWQQVCDHYRRLP